MIYKTLGIIILGITLSGIFLITVLASGLKGALIGWGISLVITSLIFLAMYLITKESEEEK
mgnify:CR=1 FL=1